VGDLVRINAPVSGGSQEVYTISDGWVDRKGNAQYTLQRSDGTLVAGGKTFSTNELHFF
jgi:hypothetical protein